MNASTPPSDCFYAQTIPVLYGNNDLNIDVGGVAVATSNIVINIVLPILLRWSPEDVHTSVVMLLSQVYPIMIATVGSINSSNLGLFDAHFAVAVTASPVVVYLVYSAFRDLLGYPNTIFGNNIQNGRTTIRCLSLVLPFLWLGVNLTISFSPRAFKNSPVCRGMTFARWFEFQAVSLIGVLDVLGRRGTWNDTEGRGGLAGIFLVAIWIWAIYVVRHRYDIRDEITYRTERQTKRGHLMKLWLRIWNIPAASWFVVTESHPWMVFVIIICLRWNHVLGLMKGMTSIEQYQLSYGQIMSLFSVLPPILALLKLLRLRYRDLVGFMKELPRNFIDGAWFLLTGFQDPPPWNFYAVHGEWPSRFVTNWPLDTCWGPVLVLWLAFTGIDAWWIFNYVKAGSIPNPRTKINSPHSAWKPFSVAMFAYGYCVCHVNIYIWSVFYDKNYFLTGTFGSWLFDARRMLSSCQRSLLRTLRLMTIPLAFTMCCGPLFSPLVALPLAQQAQWSRFCNTFEGEVILIGATDMTKTPSTASFYYPNSAGSDLRAKYFDYSLFSDNTSQEQYFGYNATTSPSLDPPQVVGVVYNQSEQSFKVQCGGGSSNSISTCAYGTYETKPYLSFRIQDARTNSITHLRSVDREWYFADDAPSLVLKFQDVTQRPVLQTAVTHRNYCYRLKTCVASREADVAILVPLGIILLYQEKYSVYCSLPGVNLKVF